MVDDRLRDARMTRPPAPWTTTVGDGRPVGGLEGVGFAPDPGTGTDLLLVLSSQGRGVFDTVTGVRVARDRDPDADIDEPDEHTVTCAGIGPLAGRWVQIVGLFGGRLPTSTVGGWSLDIWDPGTPAGVGGPHLRIVLRAGGSRWVVHDVVHSELRAAGFSSSGRTLVVATSSDVWWATRPG